MALSGRAGVPPSRVYLPPGPWTSLLEFLSQRFPRIPSAILRQRLEAGDIVDEQGHAQMADAPYHSGRWLWYYRVVPDETPLPFELPVLYRGARLLVVDKPHFMATTPGGRHLHHTALVRMRRELDLPTLSPMHRLDRETAGVLLFCIDPAYRGRYQQLFQAREVDKEYEAVAAPCAAKLFPLLHRSRLEENPGRFVMREVDGEPNSETRIELMRTLGKGPTALFRLSPLTGRKHQLRAHMSALGMPIVNDTLYPVARAPDQQDDFERPLQLLARSVEFRDPIDGRMRRFESRRALLLADEQ